MPASSHWIIDSPIGELTLVSRAGALVGIYMHEHRHAPDVAAFGARSDAAFTDAIIQLDQYFARERTHFELPLAASGTAFQQQVWRSLADIPYGETRTYAQIAASIGRPSAVRAVGAANGRNPLSIVVPCHRVLGASGALTGYAGGLSNKTTLLRLEGAID